MKLGFIGVSVMVLAGAGNAQVTERESVASNGVQGNATSALYGFSISSTNGRYVAFGSLASNLVAGDNNGAYDVFVRDRLNQTTTLVSVSTGGTQGNADSGVRGSSISADGRFVVFESAASNLVPNDTNGVEDVFVRDLQGGTTELVSVSSGGVQGFAFSGLYGISISEDGRYVAFSTYSSNLVPGDTNGQEDVFVRDRQNGTTELVSVSTGGVQGNGRSYIPSISADGRYVAFASHSSNLVPGDTNGLEDVFLRDRHLGTTEIVSVSTGGAQGNVDTGDYGLSVSPDGLYVVFTSGASNLVPGDTNLNMDVFVRDRRTSTTERVSVSSAGVQGNGFSGGYPSISICAGGRFVAFRSSASNLVSGAPFLWSGVYVRDRESGTTERVSVSNNGTPGHNDSNGGLISADGRYVAFDSFASDLVAGDTNGYTDVFLHDRDAAGFKALCEPAVSGVIACPCSNQPSAPGRGCDNSSATGGAILSASGAAYLSIDSLVFASNGERATATSIVLQGTAFLPTGVIYGQGVRCVGGSLERLFTKHAVAGSITAPDFGAGDPTVSARSASLGDVIQPGQSRYYLVYYRDPVVLGGCPASATFNATQTGQVTWWP